MGHEEASVIGQLGIIIGAFGTMIGGFYAIARVMLNQASKDREADREERKAFIESIDNMAGSNVKIAEELAKGNRESAERNGHLGELIIKQGEVTKAIADKSVEKIISSVKVQNVDKQNVEHQTVNAKG